VPEVIHVRPPDTIGVIVAAPLVLALVMMLAGPVGPRIRS
jgi:hypothetical protein